MTILTGVGGDIIYIWDDAGTTVHGNNPSGSGMSLTWPVTVQNTDASATTPFKIIFVGDAIALTTANQYFECGSNWIQFGSESLPHLTLTRPEITIQDVIGYPGLIRNGTSVANGYSNISIFNLVVKAGGTTILDDNGGWIGQAYFAKTCVNNVIINCHSEGSIPAYGGGIVGRYGAQTAGGLTIVGCDSTGNIGNNSGGIIGSDAGAGGGMVTIQKCWSIGDMSDGDSNGGIVGGNAASGNGEVTVTKCYSIGAIASNGGGIIGINANSGVTVEECYSTGSINDNGGGIVGSTNNTITAVSNCYSTAASSGPRRGIFAFGSGTTPANCYAANGVWSDAIAQTRLEGHPSTSRIGETWISIQDDQPYLLKPWISPYLINNIDVANKDFYTYSPTVVQGESSGAIIDTNWNQSVLLAVDPTEPTIDVNLNNGNVITTTDTPAGTYEVYVLKYGFNNIAKVILTVTALPSPSSSSGTTVTQIFSGSKGLTSDMIYDVKAGLAMIGSQSGPLKVASYADYLRYKKAAAGAGSR